MKVAVDQIQWKPGWQKTPEDEFIKSHQEWLSQNDWLIDGFGNWESIEQRFKAADIAK